MQDRSTRQSSVGHSSIVLWNKGHLKPRWVEITTLWSESIFEHAARLSVPPRILSAQYRGTATRFASVTSLRFSEPSSKREGNLSLGQRKFRAWVDAFISSILKITRSPYSSRPVRSSGGSRTAFCPFLQAAPPSAVRLSLSIWKDGQVSISYGSMPRWVRVTPGTFDFDYMIDLLRARSYPQGDRPFDSQSIGTVALPGSEALRRIDDVGLVRSLLEKAWKARMAPTRDSPAEDYNWIGKACSFAE